MPRPLYVPQSEVSAFLLGRKADWMICAECGQIGLTARHSRKVHSWADRPELKDRVELWNADELQRRKATA
jgi:hypothetical protein